MLDKFDFSIRVGNLDRLLFSVEEKRKGDLMLYLHPAEQFEGEGQNQNIKQQRYSIHPSPNSSQGINVIKHTLELKNKKILTSRNYTKVIKRRAGFCNIFSRRSPNLSPDHYNVNSKRRLISLGEYDPITLTLIYSIYISHPDVIFTHYKPIDFNVLQHKFTYFNLILLWSYALFPSHSSGKLLHNITIPTTLRSRPEGLGASKNEQEVITRYELDRDILCELFIQEMKLTKFKYLSVIRKRFYRTGYLSTAERASIARQLDIIDLA